MVHVETLVLIIAEATKVEIAHTYLRIKIIQRLDGMFYPSRVDSMLNISPRSYRVVFLLRLEVGLFGEVGSSLWVALHRKVV